MGGGDPPFENRELIVSQRKIIRFWWHLVYNTIFGTRWQSRVQIKIFLKFKMADGRHFKHRFLAITQQPIARFEWNFAFGSSFSQNFGNGTDINFLQNVFFVFLMQSGLRRAAAFVSSPIHLLFCPTSLKSGTTAAVRAVPMASSIYTTFARRHYPILIKLWVFLYCGLAVRKVKYPVTQLYVAWVRNWRQIRKNREDCLAWISLFSLWLSI